MIQETYCSFEQAKALKELGFPQTYNCYLEGWSYQGIDTDIFSSTNKMEYVKVPPSLVQKWLREEKNLHITINITSSSWYYIMLFDVSNGFFMYEDTSMHKTYEQALSAGIDKCIELLKDK